jgi:hypothetical protein
MLLLKLHWWNNWGESVAKEQESTLITAAISMNPTLILLGILGFVASFAISIGPVMWVLFSELFPNRIRGLAISFVGLNQFSCQLHCSISVSMGIGHTRQCRNIFKYMVYLHLLVCSLY